MGEIYEGLCNLKEFLGVLWIVNFIWLAVVRKSIYRHMNNLPFLSHVDWMVKAHRRIFLVQAFLPPFTFFNFLCLFLWYVNWKDIKRHIWDLMYQRLRLRALEKEVLRKEGFDGLVKMFEKTVHSVSEYLQSLEPGSTRYNLTANLYIKCQRRLERMKRGENFGHFPIPE